MRTGGPIVYRLGRYPFKVERRVRFPLGLSQRDEQQRCGTPQPTAGVVGGRSSVWLEHSTVTREVAGSSPVGPVVRGSKPGERPVDDRRAPRCPGGEIGRHAILRGWCRKASRFESAPGHSQQSHGSRTAVARQSHGSRTAVARQLQVGTRHSSSVVEHPIRNRAVVSSILTCGSGLDSRGRAV